MPKNDSEKKLEEANFEVSSLAEVKDANGNGIFHMRTKTKFVLVISILILLAAGGLIYLSIEKLIQSEMWQIVLWGLCGVLAIYSIFSKSILAMLLNLILFAGVSFIPTWQSGYDTVQPIIEKFSEQTQQPAVENLTPPVEEKISEPEKTIEEIKPVEPERSAETSNTESQIELPEQGLPPSI